ncbi:MarR family winged helix-turn-helix transcriptional regulator [Nocardioides panacihumi]
MDSYVQAMGRGHELHRTDLSALAVVMDATSRGEQVTPRNLARAVRISPSAMSALLDRLEQAGHLTRRPHPDDRRSIVVDITDSALATGGAIFGPVGRATAAVMGQYSEEQLQLVARFLDQVAEVTEQLAADPSAPPSR